MRKLPIVLALVAFFALTARAADAQVVTPSAEGPTVGPTLAFHTDNVGVGIGASFMTALASINEQVGFIGSFIYFFPDNFDYFEFNANGTYDIPIEDSSAQPFGVAGINVGRSSFDAGPFGGFSNTDVGLNLGAGVSFLAGNFEPTVIARFTIGDGTGFVIEGTLPFQVGGNN